MENPRNLNDMINCHTVLPRTQVVPCSAYPSARYLPVGQPTVIHLQIDCPGHVCIQLMPVYLVMDVTSSVDGNLSITERNRQWCQWQSEHHREKLPVCPLKREEGGLPPECACRENRTGSRTGRLRVHGRPVDALFVVRRLLRAVGLLWPRQDIAAFLLQLLCMLC